MIILKVVQKETLQVNQNEILENIQVTHRKEEEENRKESRENQQKIKYKMPGLSSNL